MMAYGMSSAFTPGKTFTATAGAASASKELTGGRVVELQASGADVVFAFGGSSVTAAAVDATPTYNRYLVLDGQSKLVTRPIGADYVAYIRQGATGATVYVTEGDGV